MRVHVMGPNLQSKSDETFHVHAEGCADVRRAPVYQGAEHRADRENAEEFATLLEIAAYVYDFEDNPADLIGDFLVFPCAQALPEGV